MTAGRASGRVLSSIGSIRFPIRLVLPQSSPSRRLVVNKVTVVQSIYEAFGRGDVPAIIELLHPDVEWEHDTIDHGIPWLVARKGREEVVKFFESLSAIEFHHFEPVSYCEGPDQVAAFVRTDLTVKATGKRVVDLEGHLFTFAPDGRVGRFRHFIDTHQHITATRP